jgi:hypothetical protein
MSVGFISSVPTVHSCVVPQTFAEQLSYLHHPRPFKNPHYTKNVNRRVKNLKNVLAQEREREKQEREKRRLEKEQEMNVDSVPSTPAYTGFEEDTPTCASYVDFVSLIIIIILSDTSIEAPPSLLPPKKYCDITGLEVSIICVGIVFDLYTWLVSGCVHGSSDRSSVSR